MRAPVPGRARVNRAMRHAGGRDRAPHRRSRLRPTGPRPRRAHRHPRGRLRRRQDARSRRSPAWQALLDGGSPLAWATRVDDATAAAVRERWPDARDRRGRPGAPSSATCPPPVGERRSCSPPARRTAPVAAEVAATLRGQRGRLPPGGRRRCGRRAPGARRRPRHRRGRRRRRRRGHGRRAAQRGRRADRPAGRGGADVGRLRRRLRGAGRAAHDADRLRAGRARGQHRQRLRRRRGRRADREVRPADCRRQR